MAVGADYLVGYRGSVRKEIKQIEMRANLKTGFVHT